jgi:hypothetical protein
LGAPRARSSASSGLAAANELGTGVQLNGDGLDPAHGLVAVDAARVVSGSLLVVVEKRRLSAAVAAGSAAHAGIAPMHRAR